LTGLSHHHAVESTVTTEGYAICHISHPHPNTQVCAPTLRRTLSPPLSFALRVRPSVSGGVAPDISATEAWLCE